VNFDNVLLKKNNLIDLCIDYGCAKGATYDNFIHDCKNCTRGTFSLGGGQQYTFNTLESIKFLPQELSVNGEASWDYYESECKKEE
jgi:hypothetical protein